MEVQLKMQESTSDNSLWIRMPELIVLGEDRVKTPHAAHRLSFLYFHLRGCGLRGLHLADTGVYKNGLNLLRNHLIFPQVGGESA